MPAEKIYNLPILYTAKVIRPRCRKPAGECVRDSQPVVIRILDQAKTEPITIRMHRASGDQKLDLLYDGSSCLAPVEGITGTWLDEMQDGIFPDSEFDAERILLTGNNKRLHVYRDGVWMMLRPMQVPTPGELQARVRSYVSDDRADTIAQLQRIAAQLTLIDGQIYRRVPPPQWRYGFGEEGIVPGEGVAALKKKDSAGVLWWPLGRYADFAAHVNSHSKVSCRVSIKAPAALMEFVQNEDPVAEARKIFALVDDHLRWALPDLGDEAVVKFTEYRRLAEQAKDGDLDVCIAAAKALRTIAECQPFNTEGFHADTFSENAIKHLDHWEQMLNRRGLIVMSERDDDAIARIAVA